MSVSSFMRDLPRNANSFDWPKVGSAPIARAWMAPELADPSRRELCQLLSLCRETREHCSPPFHTPKKSELLSLGAREFMKVFTQCL